MYNLLEVSNGTYGKYLGNGRNSRNCNYFLIFHRPCIFLYVMKLVTSATQLRGTKVQSWLVPGDLSQATGSPPLKTQYWVGPFPYVAW